MAFNAPPVNYSNLSARKKGVTSPQKEPVDMMHDLQNAGLTRRLLAICYDVLLLFGVLFVAAIPLAFLPEAVKSLRVARLGSQGYLLAVCAVFFVWFWTHGGQTLGMRAWRVRLVASDGGKVSLRQAIQRFFAGLLSLACFGLGFIWLVFDRDGLAWHDRLSKTRLIVEPKALSAKGGNDHGVRGR
jgi:uncharacterized RDD family membrane protein YckC